MADLDRLRYSSFISTSLETLQGNEKLNTPAMRPIVEAPSNATNFAQLIQTCKLDFENKRKLYLRLERVIGDEHQLCGLECVDSLSGSI